MPRLSLTVFLLVGACAAGPDPGDGAIEGEPPDLLALDLAPRGWPCLPPPNRCPADRLCVDARCVPSPSCVDRVVNGPETDVDCGGPAGPKCPPHWGCKSNRDCANGACFGGHCDPTPLCRNGRRDRDETDVDCGGRVCLRCAEKRRCLGDDDCLGGRCANPLRAPPPCLPDLPGLPTNEGRCCDGIGRRCDERSCGGPDQCCTAAVCLTSGSTIDWPDLACGTFGRRCDSCFRKACNRHGFCANRCKTLQAMEGCDRCCDSDGRGPPGNTSASCGAVEWGCSVCGGGQVCENRVCR